jgi:hypothetical protein
VPMVNRFVHYDEHLLGEMSGAGPMGEPVSVFYVVGVVVVLLLSIVVSVYLIAAPMWALIELTDLRKRQDTHVAATQQCQADLGDLTRRVMNLEARCNGKPPL